MNDSLWLKQKTMITTVCSDTDGNIGQLSKADMRSDVFTRSWGERDIALKGYKYHVIYFLDKSHIQSKVWTQLKVSMHTQPIITSNRRRCQLWINSISTGWWSHRKWVLSLSANISLFPTYSQWIPYWPDMDEFPVFGCVFDRLW